MLFCPTNPLCAYCVPSPFEWYYVRIVPDYLGSPGSAQLRSSIGIGIGIGSDS